MNWSLIGAKKRYTLVFAFITTCAALLIFVSTAIFESSAAPGDGQMILFFDGPVIPTGWTCVSCSPGDPFYQRFVRGEALYGTTGGSPTHSHTYNDSISASDLTASTEAFGTGSVDANSHTHTLSTTLSTESNLPQYRQLQIIRHNTQGEPAQIPEGAIGIFDSATLPAGWSRYSAQDGNYIRGEDTIGSTGGNNTHSHTITTVIGAATGATYNSRGGGTQVTAAAAGHSHAANGSTSIVSIEPPFVEAILAQADTDLVTPANLIAMWDDEVPNGWQVRSDAGGPFYQRFLKPASVFGATGGSSSHTHIDTTITTSPATTTTNARSGAAGALAAHTHTVTVSSYSTEDHVPPYIDVIYAKKQEPSQLNLAGYRWFRNANSSDVGLALSAQDDPATSIGLPFRLRVAISVATEPLGISGESLKLQYAERVGTCDAGFSGETYTDVSPSSGLIRYYNNQGVNNGDTLTANLNDPTLSSGSVITQTYNEANPFTNSENVVSIGDYAIWDLALFDHSAPSNTSYCFRVIYTSGETLDSYDVIPEITTDDGQGNMVLLYDGATVPEDWSCVSCFEGQPFYQRFARGAEAYGATGGSATHSHTATAAVNGTTDSGGNTGAGAEVSELSHSHNATVQLDDASNIPPYRQLRFIRYDFSGTPPEIPENTIALFDDVLPTGWTRYAAQDTSYIRGENSVADIGGALTHTHQLSGTLDPAAGGTTTDAGGGPSGAGAAPSHTHSVIGTSPSQSHEPPYIETILGQIDASGVLPAGIITFWDGAPPSSWEIVSSPGEPFNQRFVKPSASYGATGGTELHSHANHTATSSSPSASVQARSSGGGASAAHTHSISVTAVSSENHLPPYIDTVIAKQPVPNVAPDAPTNLRQIRTSLVTDISPGNFTNETQITFRADVSDPDNPDTLQLCVEVQPLNTSFTDLELNCGTAVAYNGTPVEAEVTLSGLANTEEYYWQARTKDGTGKYSSWISFGSSDPTVRDFAIDTIAPAGTVYDGTSVGIDADYNNGSLDTLDANWNIDSGLSGLSEFELSVGTNPGTDDVQAWVSNGILTSATSTGLPLQTSQIYYFNVRTTDNAGNQSVISSDGILVSPTLSFTVTNNSSQLDSPQASNNYTSTETISIETSTNSRNGYEVRAVATDLLTNQSGQSLAMFNGGSYASPSEWANGDTGFGYTSSDAVVDGINRFTSNPCLGGGSPPCYAPYSTLGNGDIVADNAGPIIGNPIINELFTITNRVTIDPSQPSGTYRTTLLFTLRARY